MRNRILAVATGLIMAFGLAFAAAAPSQAAALATTVSSTTATHAALADAVTSAQATRPVAPLLKAKAATLWHNCPYDTICLYQWTGYGAPAGDANPGWKSSFHNLIYGNAGCINLTTPAAYWPNGTPVWDNSAALIVGGSGAYSQADSVSFYNSLNCNSSTGVASYNANWVTGVSDLHTVPIGGGQTLYHTIASIGWVGDQCPPPGC